VASETIFRMVGQNKFIEYLSDFSHLCGIGLDDHTLFDFRYAGGHQVSGSLHLYNADSAGSNLVNILQIAEMGYQDVVLFGGFEDGGSLFGLYGFVIDGKCYN